MRALLAMFLVCAPCAVAAAREKLDSVHLRNGDRLTGQIVVMQYGQLTLKSDYLGTATIEWIDVERVESPQQFVVEDLGGSDYSGVLAASDAGRLAVRRQDGTVTSLRLAEIERLYAGEPTFWNRIQGSFSVGFDYAKATDISTLAGSFDAAYRAPEFFKPVHYDMAAQLRGLGFIMRTEILWYKQVMRRRTAWGSWKSPANPHIIPSWEYVLVFSKGSWSLGRATKPTPISRATNF